MDFQTPDWVCGLMLDMVRVKNPNSILEPTPGDGNLVRALEDRYPDSEITAPLDFWHIPDGKYDLIVANPPFTPMKLGYKMLERFVELSDNVVVLMPWLTLINSERRTSWLKEVGLRRVKHLPRNAFPGSRVQTCIMEISQGYDGDVLLYL